MANQEAVNYQETRQVGPQGEVTRKFVANAIPLNLKRIHALSRLPGRPTREFNRRLVAPIRVSPKIMEATNHFAAATELADKLLRIPALEANRQLRVELNQRKEQPAVELRDDRLYGTEDGKGPYCPCWKDDRERLINLQRTVSVTGLAQSAGTPTRSLRTGTLSRR